MSSTRQPVFASPEGVQRLQAAKDAEGRTEEDEESGKARKDAILAGGDGDGDGRGRLIND